MYGAICPKHRRSYPHLRVDMDLLQRSLGGFLHILAPFRKASISMSFATFKHLEASQKLPKSTLGAYKRVETTKRRLQGGNPDSPMAATRARARFSNSVRK